LTKTGIKSAFFFIVFLIGISTLRAQSDQEFYSTLRTSEWELLHAEDSLHYLDSGLSNFHLYNAAFRQNFGLMDLGNSGSPMSPIKYRVSDVKGFDLGWHYMDANRYLYSEHSPLYRAKKPITSLFYIQGPNELLGVQALHSQNIKPNWNVGVEFRRLKENGFYLKQNTGQYNTRLYTWYHSKDYRYHLIASATWNRISNQENGGIYNKESFDTLNGPGRNPIVKYYANDVYNTLKSNTFSATQIYRLGQKRYYPTEATDSLGRAIPDTIPTFIPRRQISLRTSLSTYHNIFEVEGFTDMPFTNFLKDSVQTFDSTWYRNAGVSFGYESGAYRRLPKDSLHPETKTYFYNAFLDVNVIRVGWDGDYAAYTNVAVRGSFGNRSWIERKRGFIFTGYYGISGYNAGDYDYRLQGTNDYKWLSLGADFRSKGYEPDFTSYYYFGNHHFWFNKNFSKQVASSLSAHIGNSGNHQWIRLKYTETRLNNYIYISSNESPTQYDKALQLRQVELRLRGHVKWLNLESTVLYQQVDNKRIMPLPTWSVQHSLFAQGWLFKKSLFAKAGIDLFWSESFNGLEYVAPIRSFKVQDQANPFSVGNYPYINVYFTGRIRTVTFFMMFQHVTAELFGSSYYSSPYYPMQPRAFRLGIKWNMYE